MKIFRYIIPLLLIGITSCRDFHVALVGDSMLVEVDNKSLLLSELSSVLPKEYRGDDSVAFAEIYIEKWIMRQVKLREAERLFKSSSKDIEAMVEAYREMLLIQKLEERFVSSSVDTTYTDIEITQYYNDHATNFRLNRDIVKGEVLRVPTQSDQSDKLKELMESTSQTKRIDLVSICEKNGFEFADYSQSWVEGSEILDLLPMTRGEESDKILLRRGVNSLHDENYDYYYQIIELKRVGDIAPIEWVRSMIRTILITERQQNLIRDNEYVLYQEAMQNSIVKRLYQENIE